MFNMTQVQSWAKVLLMSAQLRVNHLTQLLGYELFIPLHHHQHTVFIIPH